MAKANKTEMEQLIDRVSSLETELTELRGLIGSTSNSGNSISGATTGNIYFGWPGSAGVGGQGGGTGISTATIEGYVARIQEKANEIIANIEKILKSKINEITKSALKAFNEKLAEITVDIDIASANADIADLLSRLEAIDFKGIQKTLNDVSEEIKSTHADVLVNQEKLDELLARENITKADLEEALKNCNDGKGMTLEQFIEELNKRGLTEEKITIVLQKLGGIDKLVGLATTNAQRVIEIMDKLDVSLANDAKMMAILSEILEIVKGLKPAVPEPPPHIPDPDPENKGKYLKGKFLTKGLEQTNILAEPKRPWYKRLAGFAVNHPVLTTLIGGAIGLGVTAAAVGVFAAAGIGGMLATANFFVPSLAIGTGIGAVAGGITSGVSNIIPAGRLERLCRKFDKQYKKCQKIDKKKDWYAAQEQVHEAKKQELKEKHNSKKGILKSRQIYKLARNFHKRAQRLDRNKKRYYTRQLVKQGEKALTTKAKVNTKEVKRGKTKALAGYVEKKKKLEEKLINGKISQEEFEEDMTYLAEDFADLDGGSAGLEGVGNQLYGDKEAIDIVDMIADDTDVTKNGMSDVVENIRKRNSREVVKIEEKVVRDFEESEQEAAELEAKGDDASKSKAKKIRDEVARMKQERQAYVDVITRSGGQPEPFIVVDENGNEIKPKKPPQPQPAPANPNPEHTNPER